MNLDTWMIAELTLDVGSLIDIAFRTLHTAPAAVLLGGIAAYAAGYVPHEASAAADRARGRWAMWVGIASLLMLATGSYNLVMILIRSQKLPTVYHMLFGVKFLLALATMFFAAILPGRSGLAQRLRSNGRLWTSLALAAAVGVYALGATLRSIPKIPRESAVATTNITE